MICMVSVWIMKDSPWASSALYKPWDWACGSSGAKRTEGKLNVLESPGNSVKADGEWENCRHRKQGLRNHTVQGGGLASCQCGTQRWHWFERGLQAMNFGYTWSKKAIRSKDDLRTASLGEEAREGTFSMWAPDRRAGNAVLYTAMLEGHGHTHVGRSIDS